MPSAGYMRAIWACARENHIDRDGVHEAIYVGFQKSSVKDLTDAEAAQLLDGMRGQKPGRRRFVPGRRPIPWERRIAMREHGRKDEVVDAVEHLINDTERQLLWKAAWTLGMTEETFRAFCLRQCGLEEPVTMRHYNKVLWAIKSMQRRRGVRPAAAAGGGDGV